MARVQLSATGFYATPKIHYDRKAGPATRSITSPMAQPAAEVAIDTLTGEIQGRARRHPA
jgi:xanthine dehydrogenase large subunit